MTIIVIVSPKGAGMGILAVRGVPEKVESWREWRRRGGCVTLDRSALSRPCQVLGASQRPGFCCLCTWLTCFIESMGTDRGRGGVDFSREESGASHRETYRAEH